MALGPGTRIGPYEVVGTLGAGGMGEVYRARDTRLHRDVALKILPEAFAADADRFARFQREAQTLAALNHPNIGAIYGFEESSDVVGAGFSRLVHALVLELVEGPTLADRIAHGPLPVDEALGIARQIAEALETAHEQGIIHRDLKPSNVKVRPDGTVKVLDFGLAKLRSDAGGAVGTSGPGSASLAPTVTTPAMTGVGLILGTAAYMSPEQARGKRVDRRADIWGFGCVLFEMLTGRRAFEGEDVTVTLGAVIHKEPDWSALPARTPPPVRAALLRCLHKDPSGRMRDIADVRLAMDGAFESGARPDEGSQSRGVSRAVLLATAAVVGALVAGIGAWAVTRSAAAARAPVRFQLVVPSQETLQWFVLSPDGRSMAFLARDPMGFGRLWVHSFESGQSRELTRAGTIESAPFWSPDSNFIAFGVAGSIVKVDVAGGPRETISKVESYTSGAWTADGTIIFAQVNGGLMRMPAAGGTPVEVTALDPTRDEVSHAGPALLPDGRHFVYLRLSRNTQNSGVYLGTLDAAAEAQSRERLVATSYIPLYVATDDAGGGHLLYVRDGALIAQVLDPDAPALTGEAVTVTDAVGVFSVFGFASVSATGMLAHRAGGDIGGGTPTWVDRSGRELGPIAGIGAETALYPRISPDGTQVAAAVSGDVWVYHVDGRPPIKLTFDGGHYSPLWSPDGQRLVYETTRSVALRAVRADGSVTEAEKVSPDGHYHPHGWSSDGRELLVATSAGGTTGWDILRLPSGGGSVAVVQTPAQEGLLGVSLSPDGQWLAYTSNVTGATEIWVRPYPGPGAPVRVSAGGGTEPVWARNGRELFYLDTARLMRVGVTTRPGFSFNPPMPLFDNRFFRSSQPPTYDVAADGRFLMLKSAATMPPPVEIVLNWSETLRSRAALR